MFSLQLLACDTTGAFQATHLSDLLPAALLPPSPSTSSSLHRPPPPPYPSQVCLSLLGTWHGGDEASKWSPTSSSLYQILLSIQGMILVEDPYFNEPSVDLMRGKAEGEVSSKRYNAQVGVWVFGGRVWGWGGGCGCGDTGEQEGAGGGGVSKMV